MKYYNGFQLTMKSFQNIKQKKNKGNLYLDPFEKNNGNDNRLFG